MLLCDLNLLKLNRYDLTYSILKQFDYSMFRCLALVLMWFLFHSCLFNHPKRYYTEQFRPQFHFSPESHWMNDPNGLIYENGRYHLFYQYYPDSTIWGPMHWGHAFSYDLMHWKHQPIALYPDSLGYIFSGSAVIDYHNTSGFGQHALVAIYTYHNDDLWQKGMKNVESQGIAYSLDEGLSWKKYKGNPILKNSGEQDFRDPKVFWYAEKQRWQMVLAAGDRIKLYKSKDLKHWDFQGDFKPAEQGEPLGVWECPDLIKMNYNGVSKWVMIINHGDKGPNGGSGTRYFVGNFDGNVFKETQVAKWLDYGRDYYAGVTFSNIPDEKHLLISWMSNWNYANKVPTKNWRGAMTLPRELTLDQDNSGYFIRQSMVEEFDKITSNNENYTQVGLPIKLDNKDLSQAELSFKCNDGLQEVVIGNTIGEWIAIEIQDSQVIFDRRKSGLTEFSERFAPSRQIMPIDAHINDFKIVLDRTSIEIFLNEGKYSMTNLFYPNENYSTLQISGNQDAIIQDLSIKNVKRVW